jgi:D-alanine-D-alanine ligase
MTLARHKFHTNRLLNGLGFLVPDACTFYSSCETPRIKTFPVIVKPNAESDSLGIDEKSVCYTLNEVIAKSKEIIEFFGAPAIIEEFIPGDEIKVAVIGNYTDAMVAGAVSVLKKGKPLLDTFQTREDVMSDYLSYSPLAKTGGLSNSVRKLAKQIHKALELNDYSRIDFRIGAQGAVYCMEVSTHPYIASTNAAFTSAALQKYNSYTEMINAIITTGRKRLKR